jgi:hypothetical protein
MDDFDTQVQCEEVYLEVATRCVYCSAIERRYLSEDADGSYVYCERCESTFDFEETA